VSQDFHPGDFLIFQLESGYGLLRLLAIEDRNGERVWHLAAFADLFLDAEMVDAALDDPNALAVTHPHLALTNRAFESTQVARMRNVPFTDRELKEIVERLDDVEISDRSIRLLLGLR
jgi:hypothetical protein